MSLRHLPKRQTSSVSAVTPGLYEDALQANLQPYDKP